MIRKKLFVLSPPSTPPDAVCSKVLRVIHMLVNDAKKVSNNAVFQGNRCSLCSNDASRPNTFVATSDFANVLKWLRVPTSSGHNALSIALRTDVHESLMDLTACVDARSTRMASGKGSTFTTRSTATAKTIATQLSTMFTIIKGFPESVHGRPSSLSPKAASKIARVEPVWNTSRIVMTVQRKAHAGINTYEGMSQVANMLYNNSPNIVPSTTPCSLVMEVVSAEPE
mmetsp:Transcript_63220/g.181824  ORF Transcript_63220/g.181824 Transcript_63220/m.181824 type:complete len:227 (-) Transcript_63220:1579-2259(-)